VEPDSYHMKRHSTDKKKTAARLIVSAEKNFSLSNYAAAIEDLKKAYSLDPENSRAMDLIKRAECTRNWVDRLKKRAADFTRRGELLRASALYEALLRINPFLTGAQARSAKVLADLEKINAFIRAGEEALRRGDCSAAILLWDKVLEIDPDNAEAVYLIKEVEKGTATPAMPRRTEYFLRSSCEPARNTSPPTEKTVARIPNAVVPDTSFYIGQRYFPALVTGLLLLLLTACLTNPVQIFSSPYIGPALFLSAIIPLTAFVLTS